MTYRFAGFVFDEDLGLRSTDGVPVRVSQRALAVLRVLLEARGRLVSGEQMLDAVWPGQDVELANVTQCVSLLRKALGDDSRAPRYVVSDYGRGYRFAAALSSGSHIAQDRISRDGRFGRALREAFYLLDLRTPVALKVARAGFARFLHANPANATALAGLAEAESTLGSYLVVEPGAAFARARTHALGALNLDSSCARAHAVLAHGALFFDGDFTAANAHCGRSLALDAHDALALRVLGRLAMVTGDLDGATQYVERELDASPRSLDALTMLGVVEQYRRRPVAAAAWLERVCALEPDASLPQYHLATCLLEAGDCERARTLLAGLAVREPTAAIRAAFARSLALTGAAPRARRILAELAGKRGVFVSPYLLSGVHVALGEVRLARERLREARNVRDPWRIFSTIEPRFEGIAV